MRTAIIVCLAVLAAWAATSVPVEQEPHHKLVLENPHVRVFLAEVPARQATEMHRHERDYLGIWLTEARTSMLVEGKTATLPAQQRLGQVSFVPGGFAHEVRNDGPEAFRNIAIELKHPQGTMTKGGRKRSKYCNPGSKSVCVEEAYLFCTQQVCVSDVTMDAGAVTMKHRHSTPHMLVPLSDMEITDQVVGQGEVVRSEKSGGVVYLNEGIDHQLTNTGKKATRFIVVVWR